MAINNELFVVVFHFNILIELNGLSLFSHSSSFLIVLLLVQRAMLSSSVSIFIFILADKNVNDTHVCIRTRTHEKRWKTYDNWCL